MNLRPAFYMTGLLLCALAASMLLPLLADLHVGHDDWAVFAGGIAITGFFGGMLVMTNMQYRYNLTARQGFLMVAMAWLVLSLFATLPFWLGDFNLSFTDAFFEAVSGITTTGATIIPDLDHAPRGILLWRAMLQWLGGVSIILMALSVLPILNVGGMQLFRSQLSETEKALPRTLRLVRSVGGLYLLLTAACAVSYYAAGLGTFDAVTHAMTTISTGGFSNHEYSFSYFASPMALVVAIIFMICGGLPFLAFLKAARGDFNPLLKDTQIRWFIGIIAACALILVLDVALQPETQQDFSLLHAVFNVVSIITGTGYTSTDQSLWSPFAAALFFFLMAVGGCAGSSSSGIKIFRFQVLYEISNAQIKQLIHPSGAFVPRHNGRALPDGVGISVMGYFFLYALCFVALALAFSVTGLNTLTSLSSAATSLANVGPGMGNIIGAGSDYTALPDASKWLMSAGMLLGRLEIVPFLVLLSPYFWRR